jgi:stage V sporulation protein G
MDGVQSNEAGSSLISITVLSVTPARAGKVFALASVEVDIDGVQIAIHGIRALRDAPVGTRIELPKFRGLNGEWQTAITLPEEVRGPIGDAVLDELIERGLAVRRFRVPARPPTRHHHSLPKSHGAA